MAEAVRAGRQQMLAHKDRVCVRGRYPLEDWLLPVLYQQDPVGLNFATEAKAEALRGEERASRLPSEVTEYREAYGFVGRDGPLLAMERALHRQAPAILIQGLVFKPREELRKRKLEYIGFAVMLAFWLLLTAAVFVK